MEEGAPPLDKVEVAPPLERWNESHSHRGFSPVIREPIKRGEPFQRFSSPGTPPSGVGGPSAEVLKGRPNISGHIRTPRGKPLKRLLDSVWSFVTPG